MAVEASDEDDGFHSDNEWGAEDCLMVVERQNSSAIQAYDEKRR
jgi:hypothetical protein